MPDTESNYTWAGLLAHYMDFAKSAVALPDEGDLGRWKQVVPSIIALHAVAHALSELNELDPAERSVGLDRAGMLISEHVGLIHKQWRGEMLPDELVELIDDARSAERLARSAGVEWTVLGERLELPHPGTIAEMLVGLGFAGDLYLASPGVPVFRGCPAAFMKLDDGGLPPEEWLAVVHVFLEGAAEADADAVDDPAYASMMRQGYRQFDFAKGGPVRDIVAAMEETLPAGQPLLIPVIVGGEAQPVPLPPRAGPKIEALPVEFVGEVDEGDLDEDERDAGEHAEDDDA